MLRSNGWTHKFRLGGLILAILFHVVMFLQAFGAGSAESQVAGYRFLFSWYAPCMCLGLPWSLSALFLAAFPGIDMLVLIAAVCLNGYLLGWPLDAVNNGVRGAV